MRAPLRLTFAVLALAACDHSSSGSATPAGSASGGPATSASAASSGEPAASASGGASPDAAPTEGMGNPPRLADADVDTLRKGLKCSAAADAKAGPCKVLAAMLKCDDWNAVSPSGDGRYIGHGWDVAGAATTDKITVLRARTVPQSEVKPWQVPVKIAIDSIGKDAGPAFATADKAISAFARHDVAPPKSPAVDFLKAKADWKDEEPAAKTMGAMVELFSESPAYVCQGPNKQIEMVRQAGSDIGVKSDGLYAELWPASW